MASGTGSGEGEGSKIQWVHSMLSTSMSDEKFLGTVSLVEFPLVEIALESCGINRPAFFINV